MILIRLRRFNRNGLPPSLCRKPSPPSYLMNNYLLPIMLCLQYGHLMMWAEQMDPNLVNMRLMERLLPQKSPILHITDLFFVLLLIFRSQLPGTNTGWHSYWDCIDVVWILSYLDSGPDAHWSHIIPFILLSRTSHTQHVGWGCVTSCVGLHKDRSSVLPV